MSDIQRQCHRITTILDNLKTSDLETKSIAALLAHVTELVAMLDIELTDHLDTHDAERHHP